MKTVNIKIKLLILAVFLNVFGCKFGFCMIFIVFLWHLLFFQIVSSLYFDKPQLQRGHNLILQPVALQLTFEWMRHVNCK